MVCRVDMLTVMYKINPVDTRFNKL